METVRSALIWAAQKLSQSGVDSPRLTAELLLGHVLGWDRVRVVSHPESPLSPGSRDRMTAAVERRAGGEPLQYILGRQEFFGLEFKVAPAVLIPRPETELLVEKAVDRAKAVAPRPVRFVDVGTGSGCIAVAFACAVPQAIGWATDISIDALAVARENAARNGVLGRIGFVRGDFLEAFAPKAHFDLVLSNPPYVAAEDAATLPAIVREHEPAVALFSRDSGLDSYQRLIPQAAARMMPGGRLLLEAGAGMSQDVARLLEQAGLVVEEVALDLQGIPRCLVARRGHG